MKGNFVLRNLIDYVTEMLRFQYCYFGRRNLRVLVFTLGVHLVPSQVIILSDLTESTNSGVIQLFTISNTLESIKSNIINGLPCDM